MRVRILSLLKFSEFSIKRINVCPTICSLVVVFVNLFIIARAYCKNRSIISEQSLVVHNSAIYIDRSLSNDQSSIDNSSYDESSVVTHNQDHRWIFGRYTFDEFMIDKRFQSR